MILSSQIDNIAKQRMETHFAPAPLLHQLLINKTLPLLEVHYFSGLELVIVLALVDTCYGSPSFKRYVLSMEEHLF